ncbi:hypothetical protein CHARACLAT_025207 [Characodon lateralis]|uniref:Secreted protein n=1 Tax=Characodon lateralis TaxID=208331 RepID=A0ABU7DE25_9TELE|nr:hypothetical protein [Characodon lateralis]
MPLIAMQLAVVSSSLPCVGLQKIRCQHAAGSRHSSSSCSSLLNLLSLYTVLHIPFSAQPSEDEFEGVTGRCCSTAAVHQAAIRRSIKGLHHLRDIASRLD